MVISLVAVAEAAFVIPAQAGIHDFQTQTQLSDQWTPAFAGVTLSHGQRPGPGHITAQDYLRPMGRWT